jgi:hypothetical protein
MLNAPPLRDLAAHMLWLAMWAKDQHLLEWLVIRAGDYLDQSLEAAAKEELEQTVGVHVPVVPRHR